MARAKPQRGTTVRQAVEALVPRAEQALFWLSVAQVLLLIIAIVGVSFALDYGLELPVFLRLALGLTAVYLVGKLLRRVRRRLRRPVALEEAAATVEVFNSELDGHLANVLELPAQWKACRADPEQELETRLLERALQESKAVVAKARIRGSLNLRPVWIWGGLAITLFLVVFVATTRHPRTASLWLRRNVLLSSVAWPRTTHVVLEREGVEWHHASRDPLEIVAWVTGKTPPQVVLHVNSSQEIREVPAVLGVSETLEPELQDRLLEESSSQNVSLPAYLRDGENRLKARRVAFILPALSEDVDLHIRAGDNRSPSVRVLLHERPRVLSTRFRLRFPAYLEREESVIENPASEVSVPEGTEVILEAQADREIRGGWVRFGDNDSRRFRLVDATNVEYRFVATETRFLDVVVEGAEWGLESRPPLRFSWLVFPDEPPSLRLEVTGVEREVTPNARVSYLLQAEDDHGFTDLALTLTRRVPGDTRKEDELEVDRRPLVLRATPLDESLDRWGGTDSLRARFPRVEAKVSGVLELEPLALAPGTELMLQGVVRDNDTRGGPKTTLSQKETLLVVGEEAFRESMVRLRLELQGEIENLGLRERAIADVLSESSWQQDEDASDDPASGEPRAEVARTDEARAENAVARGEAAEGDPRRNPAAAATDAAAGTPTPAGSSQGSATQATPSGASAGRPGKAAARNRDLAQVQRETARTASRLAERLRAMKEALERNQLIDAKQAEEMEENIAKPLDQLGNEELSQLAESLEELAEKPEDETLESKLRRQAENIAAQLETLAKGLEGESNLQAIISQLEGIIDLQERSIGETDLRVQEQSGGGNRARSSF